MLRILGAVFGLIGGFVGGTLLTSTVVGGSVGAVILGVVLERIGKVLGGSLGREAPMREAEAIEIGGENRSVIAALFWWLVMFAILAGGLVLAAPFLLGLL